MVLLQETQLKAKFFASANIGIWKKNEWFVKEAVDFTRGLAILWDSAIINTYNDLKLDHLI